MGGGGFEVFWQNTFRSSTKHDATNAWVIFNLNLSNLPWQLSCADAEPSVFPYV